MIGTLDAFRAYALERGNSAPTDAADADATAALVRASDHIRYSYVARFMSGYDETADNVEPATYEAALLELSTPGFFSATYTPGERKVLTEVRGVRWTPIADPSGSGGAAPVSTKVEALLSPYISNVSACFVV